MKNKNQLPENYKSSLISELLEGIDPKEKERIKKRMLLAARIDDALKAKGWKPKNLAEELGKSPSEISKWLSGTHNFTIDTLIDIERVLGVHFLALGNIDQKVISYSFKVSVKSPKTSVSEVFASNYKEIGMYKNELTLKS
jgi:transcriptional regulator with XRE-family HTH domain